MAGGKAAIETPLSDSFSLYVSLAASMRLPLGLFIIVFSFASLFFATEYHVVVQTGLELCSPGWFRRSLLSP